MDCSVRDNSEFLGNLFSVISPPTLFVFMGNGSLKSEVVYWEDPGLQAADLSIETIEELINSSWARQDNTTGAWVKGWTKKVSRFGTGSFIGFIVVILLPLAFSGLCCLCIKELMTSDEQQTEEQKENQEQIRRMLQSRSTSSKRAGKGLHSRRLMHVAREVPRQLGKMQEKLVTRDERPEYVPQQVTQPARMEQPTSVTQAAATAETREIEGIDEDSQQEDFDDTAGPEGQISEEPPQELMDESTPKDDNLTKRR
jgi:hypothetical protein